MNKLPETFKFTRPVDSKQHTYTASVLQHSSCVYVTWNSLKDGDESRTYNLSTVQKYVDNGDWLILEDKKDTLTVDLKITSKSLDELNEAIDKLENHILQKIKDFTKIVGNDISIVNGKYYVYPHNWDSPYVCDDEEHLVKVMDAIELLANTTKESDL